MGKAIRTGKAVSIGQSHSVMSILANNVDWTKLDSAMLQRIIDNPKQAGAEFENFLAVQTPRVTIQSVFLPQTITDDTPAVFPFEARKSFVEVPQEKGMPKFKLDPRFRNEFLGMSVAPRGRLDLSIRTLARRVTDETILRELGQNVEIDLFALYYLTFIQAEGRKGTLLTDGNANIFYLRDKDGVLRSVCVFWRDDVWYIGVNSVSRPGWWDGGRQVIVRNS